MACNYLLFLKSSVFVHKELSHLNISTLLVAHQKPQLNLTLILSCTIIPITHMWLPFYHLGRKRRCFSFVRLLQLQLRTSFKFSVIAAHLEKCWDWFRLLHPTVNNSLGTTYFLSWPSGGTAHNQHEAKQLVVTDSASTSHTFSITCSSCIALLPWQGWAAGSSIHPGLFI